MLILAKRLVVFVMVAFALPLFAQDSLHVSRLGTIADIWTDVEGLTVKDSLALVVTSFSPCLHIVNVANNAAPVEIGCCYLPSLGAGVFARGDYAYIYGGGLTVVNIADPTHPYLMGSCNLNLHVAQAAMTFPYIYLACMGNGIAAINVSNPSAPFRVGSMITGIYASAVGVGDGYLLASDSHVGLKVYDTHNLPSLTEIGEFALPPEHVADDIQIVGNYAFLAVDWTGLWILDMHDPATPATVSTVTTPDFAVYLKVVGDYTYVCSSESGIRIINTSDVWSPYLVSTIPCEAYRNAEVRGDFLYTLVGYALSTFDVSDPANPVAVGNFDRAGEMRSVVLAGDYAYVSDAVRGLDVMDVHNPSHPVRAGNYNTPNSAVTTGIVWPYAYVADYNGLAILNISDPVHPQSVSYWWCPSLTNVVDVAVSGNYAFLADNTGLRVLDITDRANPLAIAFYDSPGQAKGIALRGDYAFLADGDHGLRIINVSNPATPVPVAAFDTTSNVIAVTLDGNKAYLAEGATGVRIVDVTDPLHPVLLSNYPGGSGYRVAVADDLLYIPGGTAGLRIVDVHNLAAPVEVGHYNTPAYGEGVAVRGCIAYHADYTDFNVFDISYFHPCASAPRAPEHLVLEPLEDNSHIRLSWQPVTQDSNGGSVAILYYTIRRSRDVAAASYDSIGFALPSETPSFTDSISMNMNYYQVKAVVQ